MVKILMRCIICHKPSLVVLPQETEEDVVRMDLHCSWCDTKREFRVV